MKYVPSTKPSMIYFWYFFRFTDSKGQNNLEASALFKLGDFLRFLQKRGFLATKNSKNFYFCENRYKIAKGSVLDQQKDVS